MLFYVQQALMHLTHNTIINWLGLKSILVSLVCNVSHFIWWPINSQIASLAAYHISKQVYYNVFYEKWSQYSYYNATLCIYIKVFTRYYSKIVMKFILQNNNKKLERYCKHKLSWVYPLVCLLRECCST